LIGEPVPHVAGSVPGSVARASTVAAAGVRRTVPGTHGVGPGRVVVPDGKNMDTRNPAQKSHKKPFKIVKTSKYGNGTQRKKSYPSHEIVTLTTQTDLRYGIGTGLI